MIIEDFPDDELLLPAPNLAPKSCPKTHNVTASRGVVVGVAAPIGRAAGPNRALSTTPVGNGKVQKMLT